MPADNKRETDCPGCGAPAGFRPAGPCRDHGTSQAYATNDAPPGPDDKRETLHPLIVLHPPHLPSLQELIDDWLRSVEASTGGRVVVLRDVREKIETLPRDTFQTSTEFVALDEVLRALGFEPEGKA